MRQHVTFTKGKRTTACGYGMRSEKARGSVIIRSAQPNETNQPPPPGGQQMINRIALGTAAEEEQPSRPQRFRVLAVGTVEVEKTPIRPQHIRVIPNTSESLTTLFVSDASESLPPALPSPCQPSLFPTLNASNKSRKQRGLRSESETKSAVDTCVCSATPSESLCVWLPLTAGCRGACRRTRGTHYSCNLISCGRQMPCTTLQPEAHRLSSANVTGARAQTCHFERAQTCHFDKTNAFHRWSPASLIAANRWREQALLNKFARPADRASASTRTCAEQRR